MTPTCALCGFRDATTTTDYDYEDTRGVREVPACKTCLAPPEHWNVTSADPTYDWRNGDVSITEAAIRMAELHNGITTHDIGDAMGLEHEERQAISTGLRRGIARGRVRVAGDGMHRVFYPNRRRAA